MAVISTPKNGIMLLQGAGLLTDTDVPFTGVSVSNGIVLSYGWFSLNIWGSFTATVQVERSPDNGITFLPVAIDPTGTYAIYKVPVSLNGFSPDTGVQFRLNCTAFQTGPVNFRLTQQIELRRS
jgi:hypothetical protein